MYVEYVKIVDYKWENNFVKNGVPDKLSHESIRYDGWNRYYKITRRVPKEYMVHKYLKTVDKSD